MRVETRAVRTCKLDGVIAPLHSSLAVQLVLHVAGLFAQGRISAWQSEHLGCFSSGIDTKTAANVDANA